MLRAAGTILPPILLIHAEEDPLIALHHAHRLVAAARAVGRSIQAYYTPCGIHCGSDGNDPRRFMGLVQGVRAFYAGAGAKSTLLFLSCLWTRHWVITILTPLGVIGAA